MRTDYTVIVTVEHEGDSPTAGLVQACLNGLLVVPPGDFIDVEVTGSRPWPENPSDPKSWIADEPCMDSP